MSSKKAGGAAKILRVAIEAERAAAPPVTEDNIEVGSLIMCRWRDGVQHRAEIIERKAGPDGKPQFYVHFVQYNKRLDEWVDSSRLDFSTCMKKGALPLEGEADAEAASTPRKMTRNMKRKYDAINHVEKHSEDYGDSALAVLEREHEERTKVKNIQRVEFGRFLMDTWYYAPYPTEYTTDMLYVCEFCLKYMKKRKTLLRHRAECTVRHPPGDEIYRHDDISMYEIDGSDSKLYCQNLCLLAKLFLDHKTLYYDVEPFIFHVLTQRDEYGAHLVGYFSKEKRSLDSYNLACIMTLPAYQRKGYGRFLISMSYEISKREGKAGSPETPLSDLGKLSYMSYWTYEILAFIRTYKGNVSVRDVSNMTCITEDDIVTALTSLNLIKYYKGQHVIFITPRLVQEHLEHFRAPPLEFHPESFHWFPRQAIGEDPHANPIIKSLREMSLPGSDDDGSGSEAASASSSGPDPSK